MDRRDREAQPGSLAEHDPTAEVGPEDCEVRVQETEFSPGSLEENPDASHPKFAEELQDAFVPEHDPMVPHPLDGLPVPASELGQVRLAVAPPFTYDTVVCVEDDRTWVEVFSSEDAPPGASGDYWAITQVRWTRGGNDFPRLEFPRDRVRQRFGRTFVELTLDEVRRLDPERVRPLDAAKVVVDIAKFPRENEDDDTTGVLLLVRPIRPRCEFYKRQVFSNDAEPDPNAVGHKILFRNCMKRLSVGGAAMSLRDEAVYACDHRSPPDLVSIRKHLDGPDADRLGGEAHRVMVPLFKTQEK